MVISDKYRYLFIELYNTGSTAISNELCELYDGTRILRKHSRYHEFLKVATEEQKKYFVFSGIRNPMDSVVTEYLKLVNNHKGRYTNPNEMRGKGGNLTEKKVQLYKEVTDKKMSFEDYFKKQYKLPYDKWTRLAHDEFDFIIRYEHLQEDFATVLHKLNITPVREIPKLNETANKKSFISYYTPAIQKHAVFVFAPFMEKWHYSFPAGWNIKKAPLFSKFMYRLLGVKRNYKWKQKISEPLPARN